MKIQDENSLKKVAELLSNQPLVPVQQYKDLKFKNKQSFKNWLSRTSRIIVEFKDFHQDLIKIWLDEHGELLHAEMQSFLKPGYFFRKIIPGKAIEIYDGIKWDTYWQLIVDNVVYKEKTLPRNSRVISEKKIIEAISTRILKPGSIKAAHAWEICSTIASYAWVCEVFNKVMMQKVNKGEAKKIMAGTYWINAKSI
jgi:hypothetical protein